MFHVNIPKYFYVNLIHSNQNIDITVGDTRMIRHRQKCLDFIDEQAEVRKHKSKLYIWLPG